MKTLISLILLGIAFSFQLFAQNPVCDKVFNSYAGTKGLLALNISKKNLAEFFADVDKNEDCVISSVKILVVEDTTMNPKINFYNEVIPNLNLKEYEELMTVKNKEQQLVILCRKQNQKIKEFILVSGGNDNSLIYIKGSFSMENLNKISKAISNHDKLKELEQESRN